MVGAINQPSVQSAIIEARTMALPSDYRLFQVALPPLIELPWMESPDAPALARLYMKSSAEACARCRLGDNCPDRGKCPTMGVIPVESSIFIVDEPRLRVSHV